MAAGTDTMTRLSADGPLIYPDCQITTSTFGPFTEVGRASVITHTEFHAYAYCERLCDIANTTVGRFANIAAMARIGPTDHPMHRASQHHFLYRSSRYWDDATDDAAFFAHRESRRTTLGPDCWIGHAAIIRPEVTIGTGAVVAAGAVVTKDVPPFTIVAGVPAKPIRTRFPDTIIDRLLALAWWDWDHDRLRSALDDFRSLPVEDFLDRHGG